MGLLEIELSTRAQEDDEERRRKGQANFTSSTHASASAVSKGGKGGGKGKAKSKGKAKEGKGDKKPVCQDYMTDRGCPRGDQCTHLHPCKPGKCLRCGATGHDLASCRRPARDVRTNAPPAAKPKASPPPLPKKGKGKGNAKAKPKPKAQVNAASANAIWAAQETDATVTIEDVTDQDVAMSAHHISSASACSFYTTFLPTFHAASSADPSREDHPKNLPILDTGATHCLMPLTWLSTEECNQAKRIHLKVATGTTVRALLFNTVIYAKSVNRPLISVGQLKGMLDLRLIWDHSSPLIIVCYAGKKYVLLQANVVHHLPLVSRSELQTLLNAIHDFTTKGELWKIHKWSAALNKQLDEFYWSNPDSSPPGISMHAAHDEAQAMFSSIDVTTSLLNQDTESPPETLRLEDFDAKTE